jgi:hypothetical protein
MSKGALAWFHNVPTYGVKVIKYRMIFLLKIRFSKILTYIYILAKFLTENSEKSKI